MCAAVRDIHDHYFKEAKRLGYAARSAFKLIEIQNKKKIIRKGNRILDLGCAPGAWLQVACQNLGPTKSGGIIVGVDLKPVRKQNKYWDDRIITIHGDAFAKETEDLIHAASQNKPFDIVLSDMMDSTIGHQGTDHLRSVHIARGALTIAKQFLKPGGSFIVKCFEGAEYPDFLKECKSAFSKAKGFSPKASRHESTEMFIVCQNFHDE